MILTRMGSCLLGCFSCIVRRHRRTSLHTQVLQDTPLMRHPSWGHGTVAEKPRLGSHEPHLRRNSRRNTEQTCGFKISFIASLSLPGFYYMIITLRWRPNKCFGQCIFTGIHPGIHFSVIWKIVIFNWKLSLKSLLLVVFSLTNILYILSYDLFANTYHITWDVEMSYFDLCLISVWF